MIKLDFYTRQGCHLCEVALEWLLPMLREGVTCEVHDIDTCQQWREDYDVRVPVIERDGRLLLEYPFDRAALRQMLAEMPENTAEIGILRG